MTKKADRIAEAAIVVILILLGVLIFHERTSVSQASPGDMITTRKAALSQAEMEAFRGRLRQARLLADSNQDADEKISELEKAYPGRHEVWALSGRYEEASGNEEASLSNYARAVRLHPDYLDEGSPDYLGTRIKRLNDSMFSRLTEKKKKTSLSTVERQMLDKVYFLRRRFAGGCE